MKEHIIEFVSQFPDTWATFLLAMIPITELRASIPIAITVFGLPPLTALLYSLAGNILTGVIILIIAKHFIYYLLKHVPPLERLWNRYIRRIEMKHAKKFERWGSLALILFVAIPLPMTGIVTGAIAASIFQVPTKRAIALLSIGALIAGIIVTLLTVSVGAVF